MNKDLDTGAALVAGGGLAALSGFDVSTVIGTALGIVLVAVLRPLVAKLTEQAATKTPCDVCPLKK